MGTLKSFLYQQDQQGTIDKGCLYLVLLHQTLPVLPTWQSLVLQFLRQIKFDDNLVIGLEHMFLCIFLQWTLIPWQEYEVPVPGRMNQEFTLNLD